jgi:peptidoglycan/LPS O-acetylase OafA/YrhL
VDLLAVENEDSQAVVIDVPGPKTSSSVERRFYRPELDVLRFTAFFMVFFHHYPRYPARHPSLAVLLTIGRSGLTLFFILSAYLLTELMMRERETTGKIHIRAFFLRRVLRIWPLYFLAIGLAAVLGMMPSLPHLPFRALPYLFVPAANVFISHHGWALGLIVPLWSLSIEEQFYFGIPFVMKLSGVRTLRNLALLCIGVAYVTLAWLGSKAADPVDVVWVNSFVQFQFFAAGTLIAILLYKRAWSPSWAIRAAMFFGGFLLLYLDEAFFHLHRTGHPVSSRSLCIGYLGVLIGSVVIFLAFFRAPATPPGGLVYLGKISFGLYVFHSFANGLALNGQSYLRVRGFDFRFLWLEPLILLATVGTAALSYHFFERRILRLKERFAYVKTTPQISSTK